MSLVNSHGVIANDVGNDENDIAAKQDDAVSSQVRVHARLYFSIHLFIALQNFAESHVLDVLHAFGGTSHSWVLFARLFTMCYVF